MAHIYMTFDFGTDEQQAQQARHKLDGWKQAFRLDKKLTYKFERTAQGDGATGSVSATKEAAKGARAGKAQAAARATASKEKEEPTAPSVTGPVKLHLRLAFSGHEKMTEQRWVKRIPTEDPFKGAGPATVKESDAGFAEIEGKFDALEG
jgi:hypothetical protein